VRVPSSSWRSAARRVADCRDSGGRSARTQSDAELKALNQRVIELYRAGKYGEAVPFAEHYNRREHLSSVPSQMWWKLTNGDRNSPPA